ncbi:MAG: hypothetical protein J2P36_37155, partial [Ktedonobacteraceae bacterium]|nr:hypothetical protein [Ktedonobacteraceae bacterium]
RAVAGPRENDIIFASIVLPACLELKASHHSDILVQNTQKSAVFEAMFSHRICEIIPCLLIHRALHYTHE